MTPDIVAELAITSRVDLASQAWKTFPGKGARQGVFTFCPK